MHALVTGANGFLGTWLTRRLVEQKAQVRCLVRRANDDWGLKDLPISRVEGDVTRPESLAAAVDGVDVVFHLAGIRRAPSPALFSAVNAGGTRNLCEALVRLGGTRRLVLCGSLAAMGPSTPERPRQESDPFQPSEAYGASKAEAEAIAFSYAGRLEVAVVRPPRILGPGDKENLVFFKMVKKGLRLVVGGGPRPLSMVDVEDVVDMLLLLGERKEAVGEAFFVTRPETTTLEQLQDWVAEFLGARPRTLYLPPAVLTGLSAAADVASGLSGRHLPLNRKLARQLLAPAWTCSADKALKVLGYSAAHPLKASVERSARWYSQQGWI